MKPWLDLIRSCLLPALSASNITASFDVDVWRLLNCFPYTVRFGLYGEWRDVTCGNGPKACPIAAQAANEASRDVKRALQRVTAASSNPTGGIVPQQDRGPARALAKLSHSNPCALWSTVVTQVKSYPNIGTFIVEAGRYMTQLSMDVAGFVLVEALTSEKRAMLNDNADVADWLAST
jgi:THO complex subunit 2